MIKRPSSARQPAYARTGAIETAADPDTVTSIEIADETFVGSVLSTPRFAPHWESEHLPLWLWYIGWGGGRQKSPPWLGIDDFDTLAACSTLAEGAVSLFFARKFSTAHSTDLLDAVDARLRRRDGEPTR